MTGRCVNHTEGITPRATDGPCATGRVSVATCFCVVDRAHESHRRPRRVVVPFGVLCEVALIVVVANLHSLTTYGASG
jgi:hypothetical protein